MNKMSIREKMLAELAGKEVFQKAEKYAFDYINGIEEQDVYPNKENLKQLEEFDEVLQDESLTALAVLEKLHRFGTEATVAQTGGRYFGFVNGGAVPASLGVKWLSDVWDQNGGLYLISPINAKLETVCESWLKDVFGLPDETVAGFVSGSSMANLSGLAAARFRAYKNLAWDFNKNGFEGAPKIRVIIHEQVHASIKKTLALLGFGSKNIETVPSDEEGRIIVEKIPTLDESCILILQAGNANTGAFDDFDQIMDTANKAKTWVHIDGAFGLWAAAVSDLKHLTKGFEKANSWAVDGHKTLNTPYDSGVVLCSDEEALLTALQATGECIIYSEARDPILYGPEMSKRSRAIEFWATMKYLGKNGIDEMILGFHQRAKQLESGLKKHGLEVVNEVVFNQVLVRGGSAKETQAIIQHIQESRKAWVGGTTWQNKPAIRVSICSWMTSEEDIDILIDLFKKGKTSY